MKHSLLALSVCVITGLAFFQNCGDGFKASAWGDSSQLNNGGQDVPGDDEPLPPLPTTNGFKKGDPFNYASVPKTSQMVQVQLDVMNYSNYTAGAKAVAINSSGLGYVSLKNGGTQGEANLTALESCFTLGGGSPCGLLAEGNVFALDSADLAASYTYTLDTPQVIGGASIPMVRSTQRIQLANDYNAAANPKALALSVDGTFAWVSGDDLTPATSLTEAKRLALERCEMSATISPCTLFAENNAIVFTPTAISRLPAIDYGRSQVGTNVPGMKDSSYTNNIQNIYLPQVNGVSMFGVIYISANGVGGMAYNTSANAAESNALNLCQSYADASNPCFRYATNLTVTSMSAQLRGLKFSLDLHCKVVPRANCSQHKAMGCAAGSYYTMNGNTPTLENCL